MKERKKIILKRITDIFFALTVLFTFAIVSFRQYGFLEVDSYVLPAESLQNRGSIIITQEDIISAKQNMPDLYWYVENYTDLHSSKLCVVDENRWLAWYFPLYAILCLPVKLLFQVMKWNQLYSFTFSNGIFFVISLFALYRYIQKSKWVRLPLAILAVISPIWIYLHYIGGEPLAFSALLVSMITWEEKKYKTSALIISVVCMMNPAIMGFGIILFADYFINTFIEEKKVKISRTKMIDVLKMCCCYVPSLIPFAINKYYLNTFNPTSGTGKEDSFLGRVFAYFFDLNFGFASISVFIVLLFFAAVFYSIVRRKRHIFMRALSVIFTVCVISFHVHINCGMLNCARYVLWIYPALIFTIYDFLEDIFKDKELIIGITSLISAGSIIFVFFYNGGFNLYHFNYLSNISSKVLDTLPECYVSFCHSTFNSRVNHIDGGYDLSGYTVYTDSENGEVRKIMYCNTDENKKEIRSMLESESDVSLNKFNYMLKDESDSKIYFININRFEDTQYRRNKYYKSNLYYWIKDFYDSINEGIDDDELLEMTKKLSIKDEGAVSKIFKLLDDKTKELDNSSYIHSLYMYVLERDEDTSENESWSCILDNGGGHLDIYYSFINSDEFNARFGLNN